jgi:hypothetical protein
MPTIEYSITCQAGSHTRGFPDVYVMKKGGGCHRVPCAGCVPEETAKQAEGHYVKVIATRYTLYNPKQEFAVWNNLSEDEAVLGWRTSASSRGAGMSVIFLLEDKRGQLIIVPRFRTPTEEVKNVGNG